MKIALTSQTLEGSQERLTERVTWSIHNIVRTATLAGDRLDFYFYQSLSSDEKSILWCWKRTLKTPKSIHFFQNSLQKLKERKGERQVSSYSYLNGQIKCGGLSVL